MKKKYFVTMYTWISVSQMAYGITKEVCETFEHAVVSEDYVKVMAARIKFIMNNWQQMYPRCKPWTLAVTSEHITLCNRTGSNEKSAFCLHLTEVKHEYLGTKGGGK